MEGVHPLKQWRKLVGISQRAAAARLGTTKPTISRIESGKRSPSFTLAAKLSEGTGIPIERFAKPKARAS